MALAYSHSAAMADGNMNLRDDVGIAMPMPLTGPSEFLLGDA